MEVTVTWEEDELEEDGSMFTRMSLAEVENFPEDSIHTLWDDTLL